MTSTAVCNYGGSNWELNSAGQSSCQMYAALQGQCNSAFTIASVLPTDPAYPAPQTACGCNVVAYNLMAGCGWCQNNIYSSWWLTYAQWQGNCTTTGVTFSTTLPASINAATLTLPVWATLIPDATTWDPDQASLAAVIATPSLTATSAASSATINILPTLTTATRDQTFSFNSYPDLFTYTGPRSGDDGFYGNTSPDSGKSAGIAIGVILGLYALAAIVIGIVYFIRQKERLAWYGPMAQYYAAQKGGAGGGGASAPQFYNPQQPYDPAKTPATTSSGNQTYGYQPPPPESQAYLGYDTSHVPPHNADFSNNATYTGYQPPSNNAPYSIPSNTASVYGAPQQGPPPGAGAPMGYRGVAEV